MLRGKRVTLKVLKAAYSDYNKKYYYTKLKEKRKLRRLSDPSKREGEK
jgi:hypothetical protein